MGIQIHEPPQEMIAIAIREAKQSPCAKVKRGAVVFDARPGALKFSGPVSRAYNGPPPPIVCDGSLECARTCSMRCAHAEGRAVRLLVEALGGTAHSREHEKHYDILHVKLDFEGRLAASGPPRCWQCARDILDVELGGVWMFETDPMPVGVRSLSFVMRSASWKRYTALDFYKTTAISAGIIL